jgi:dihydrofolate reductase
VQQRLSIVLAFMTKVIYSMSVSLDGFIAGPGGNIDWSAPDEELHQFHNDRVRELGAHFLGRRLYEVMLYWENHDPSWGPIEDEFAAIWQALPRVVFSTTLESVEGNARLASGGIADEVAALRDRVPDGQDIGVGGAGLAAAFTELGLIDEYQLFVNPVVLGGGTPFFPALAERINLELLETRTFGSRVEYLRYRRV